jgi:hypothetical protein
MAAERDVRRLRAEFVAGVGATLRQLRQVELEAGGRARDLAELGDRLGDDGGAAAALLASLTRDLTALADDAGRALEHVAGVDLAALADRLDGGRP